MVGGKCMPQESSLDGDDVRFRPTALVKNLRWSFFKSSLLSLTAADLRYYHTQPTHLGRTPGSPAVCGFCGGLGGGPRLRLLSQFTDCLNPSNDTES